ncbi:MAG: hypothetical protein H5T43_00850 [Methanomethylovorans sp.]|jgi:hypothetical protein|nr:hypothetical protein [Methanomethylovorans sp.]
MAKIQDKAVLEALLRRMYWIEAEMEQLGTWEARIQLMDESIELLQKLSHDSDKHWSILKKWLLIAGISVPMTTPPGLPTKIFNFNGMAPPRMFHEIMKYEILARDAYIDILNADSAVIEEILPDETDRKEFIEDIKSMIKDEEEHRKICASKAGGFKTIA